MNVNPIIENALKSLKIPIAPDIYKGNSTEYITYNYADERPVVRADDTDLYDETTIQVHYFTRGNPHTLKKEIRRLLRQADFTIISTSQFYEDDYTHVVVEAWIEGVIND